LKNANWTVLILHFSILILTFSIFYSAEFIVRIQFTRPILVKQCKLPGSRSRRLPWALDVKRLRRKANSRQHLPDAAR
jgi:hypothetical protein